MIVTGGREDRRSAPTEDEARRDELDSVLVYGFIAEAGTDVDCYLLAATCAELEAEHRAAEWDALDSYLAAVGPNGKVVIPDALPEWERWATACALLGWHRPGHPEGERQAT